MSDAKPSERIRELISQAVTDVPDGAYYRTVTVNDKVEAIIAYLDEHHAHPPATEGGEKRTPEDLRNWAALEQTIAQGA